MNVNIELEKAVDNLIECRRKLTFILAKNTCGHCGNKFEPTRKDKHCCSGNWGSNSGDCIKV